MRIFFIFFGLCFVLYDAFPQDLLWYKVDTTYTPSQGMLTLVDQHGSMRVITDGGGRFQIHNYDSTGNEIWPQVIDSPGIRYLSAALDKSGNLFISGGFLPASCCESFNGYLLKISPSGSIAWMVNYDYEANHDEFYHVTTDDFDNVYVTGVSQDFDYHTQLLVAKYSSDGNLIWSKHIDTVGYYHTGHFIELDKHGNIYVAGRRNAWITTTSTPYDIVVVKLNSSGTVQFIKHLGSPSNYHDIPASFALDNDGNAMVTAYTFHPDSSINHYFIAKFSDSGNLDWTWNLNRLVKCGLLDIAVDTANNIYTAGTITDGHSIGYLIKFNPDGDTVWTRRYSGYSDNYFRKILFKDNALFLTGDVTDTSGYTDIPALKYDLNGNLKWKALFNGLQNNNDWGTDIALDGSGNVFVCGGAMEYANNYYNAFIGKFHDNEFVATQIPVNYETSIRVFPIPFTNILTFSLELTSPSLIEVNIYDFWGRKVGHINQEYPSGQCILSFKTKKLSSGIYFYVINIDGKLTQGKIINLN